jgi:hypothetical protein
MNSCNDCSNDDESKEKDGNKYHLSPRKRQIAALSFEPEAVGLKESTTENTDHINQLKKPRHKYSSTYNQAIDEGKEKKVFERVRMYP